MYNDEKIGSKALASGDYCSSFPYGNNPGKAHLTQILSHEIGCKPCQVPGFPGYGVLVQTDYSINVSSLLLVWGDGSGNKLRIQLRDATISYG
jgi:hypothetical protein